MRPILVPIITFLVLTAAMSARVDPALDASQQARYQKLCESLVAPCCWSESLALHRSPEAMQARDEVAALILQGKPDQDILDDFAARYGTRVLIEPPGSRARWLYVLPAVALVAGFVWVIRFLRSRTRRRPANGTPPAALDDSEWDW